MKKGKKRYILVVLFILFLILSFVKNPTQQDYIEYTSFSEEQADSFNENVEFEIERINFYILSTYAPKEKVLDHYGNVHLPIYGTLFSSFKRAI
ncbi:hypothetical protein E1I69_17610 [Bacillus timonensis]|uniref:Uncharacterized protein n=1 Tax=Bacillus timonensis TaxID=1033734 RepID=A0A4S3PPV7_9BACI|nr:hypothetical protein [Bacillus timonensis]THE10762.1 hypothetical protein E1I69_17610 [Bacillus timonensis]